jgi:hypothetical protein
MQPGTLPAPNNPFAKAAPAHISAGAVAIESERAIAEAQGRLLIAKRFPRDEAAAFARVMDACRRPSLADVAHYRFPRGGQSVEGPSIRLAEELARCWGSIHYGIRELSRRDGESEMEAFAWDLQTNVVTTQTFTVRHLRDKRGGPEALRDERDIYEVTANMGARRLRARILAVLPPDLVDAAVRQCRDTVLNGSDKPLPDRIREMTQAFAKIGVTAEMLAVRLGRSLDTATPEDLVELRGIYQGIRDGASSVREWFSPKGSAPPAAPPNADGFEAASAGQQQAATPSADPKPAEQQQAAPPPDDEADLPEPLRSRRRGS